MKKNNNTLYIILTIASVACCGVSLAFDPSHKAFTMLASIGCSGIVSVLVAWLLERSNEKIMNAKNEEILSCLLRKFDVMVRIEMQRALVACAKANDIELNKNYSISDICGFVEKLSSDHVYFRGSLDAIQDGLENVPVDMILQFEQGERGIRLHTLFTRLKQNISVIEWIENENIKDDMLMLVTVQSLYILEDIYLTRNIHETYSVPDQSKNYIKSFRAAINKRKVVE